MRRFFIFCRWSERKTTKYSEKVIISKKTYSRLASALPKMQLNDGEDDELGFFVSKFLKSLILFKESVDNLIHSQCGYDEKYRNRCHVSLNLNSAVFEIF